jgi:hypothetical protein
MICVTFSSEMTENKRNITSRISSRGIDIRVRCLRLYIVQKSLEYPVPLKSKIILFKLLDFIMIMGSQYDLNNYKRYR